MKIELIIRLDSCLFSISHVHSIISIYFQHIWHNLHSLCIGCSGYGFSLQLTLKKGLCHQWVTYEHHHSHQLKFLYFLLNNTSYLSYNTKQIQLPIISSNVIEKSRRTNLHLIVFCSDRPNQVKYFYETFN